MTTKQKVFQILTENKGSHVSGEKLAQTCNVSRAAIWKAIKAIRDEGFEIDGSNNKGYTLADKQTADVLSQAVLEYTLGQTYPEFAHSHIECFETIDSTNTYAKKLVAQEVQKLQRKLLVLRKFIVNGLLMKRLPLSLLLVLVWLDDVPFAE